MKSSVPKVLHALCGRPLVRWVLSAVAGLNANKIYLVVGQGSKEVKLELKDEKIVFVEQKKQLGTGHALRRAEKYLKDYGGDILVLCADTPLIKSETLGLLVDYHRENSNSATVLSCCVSEPFGYGRIVRIASGEVERIVEEKDADEQQKKIKEINSGIYCFSSRKVWDALCGLSNKNAKREYYLTDVISILSGQGEKTGAYSEVSPDEILGVNDRLDLSKAESIERSRILEKHMLEGVTIVDPNCTYISAEPKIGRDTIIYPGTIIEGKTVIGENCRIGPYSFIRDSVVANGVEVRYSNVFSSKIDDMAKIGPYSHIRPGTRIKHKAKIGNFSEVKNSVIGNGSKVNHLSYIGDSFLGKDVNIGAGTITCNYDGKQKSKTYIGDRSFVGSNVNLVAPVKVGRDTLLGAGSTITENVPSNALAIARARQVNKPRKNKL